MAFIRKKGEKVGDKIRSPRVTNGGSRRKTNVVTTSLFLFTFSFLVAFLASSHFNSSEPSYAAAATYYANIASSASDLSFDITSTPDGVAKLKKDTLTVNTNAPSGYKLYISTKKNAPGTGLYYTDASTNPATVDTTKFVSASSGTPEEPKVLKVNTWGYIPARRSSEEQVNSYTEADLRGANARSVISGLPAYDEADVLYTNTSPSNAATNTLDVYYGVNVSTALPSGTYTNTVVYTAIVDEQTPAWTATISPASQEGLSSGTDIVIPTSLYPGIPANEIGDVTVKIGGNYATDVNPSIDSNGKLIISAKSPATSIAGKKDVSVYVAKYNKTYTIDQGYEYIISVTTPTMQEFAPTGSEPVGMMQQLSDARDGRTYSVLKLADGNWWMMNVLRIGGASDAVLDSTNTDIASGTFTLKAQNTGDWCNTNDSACTDQSVMTLAGTDIYGGHTSFDTLYNWYAASAGSSTDTSSTSLTSTICPKGWTLPTVQQLVSVFQATTGVDTTSVSGNGMLTGKMYSAGFAPRGSTIVEPMTNTKYGPFSMGQGAYWSKSSNGSSVGEGDPYIAYTYQGQLFDARYATPRYTGANMLCVKR